MARIEDPTSLINILLVNYERPRRRTDGWKFKFRTICFKFMIVYNFRSLVRCCLRFSTFYKISIFIIYANVKRSSCTYFFLAWMTASKRNRESKSYWIALSYIRIRLSRTPDTRCINVRVSQAVHRSPHVMTYAPYSRRQGQRAPRYWNSASRPGTRSL